MVYLFDRSIFHLVTIIVSRMSTRMRIERAHICPISESGPRITILGWLTVSISNVDNGSLANIEECHYRDELINLISFRTFCVHLK